MEKIQKRGETSGGSMWSRSDSAPKAEGVLTTRSFPLSVINTPGHLQYMRTSAKDGGDTGMSTGQVMIIKPMR